MPAAGASAVRYGKSHQPGLCRARRISLIVFFQFSFYEDNQDNGNNWAFQTRLVFIYVHYVLRECWCSLCTVAIAVLVSGNCVYVTHSSLCLSAQCAYITKAWYAWYVNIQQFTCCVSASISNKISVSTVTRHERVTVHSACITDTVSVFTINRQIDW